MRRGLCCVCHRGPMLKCMDCCRTDLGKVPHNAPLALGQVALKAGKYVYRLNYLGAVIYQEQVVAEVGDDLIIPGPFNEDYAYELMVIDPDMIPVNNAQNEECLTWIFTTFLAVNTACNGTNECDTDQSTPGDYTYS